MLHIFVQSTPDPFPNPSDGQQPMTPSGNEQEKRREDIVSAVAMHLVQKGFGASGIRALAESAGISDRMLIYYFETKDNLIAVNISITSMFETTRRILEPRTTTIKKRFETVKTLSEHGIPVNVMLAPIIPSINSHEILPLAKAVSEAGALSIAHTIVRLNGAIAEIFTDWINKTMPDRAEKVLHQIESCHGGHLNDSRFGTRMRGEGEIAKQINAMVKLAKLRYFKDKAMPKLNTDLHEDYKYGQLKLF